MRSEGRGHEELRGEPASLLRGGRSSVVAIEVCKQAGMNFSSGNNGAVLFASLTGHMSAVPVLISSPGSQ